MDVKETAARLRAQVQAQSGRGARWRFDSGFRAEVVAYMRARQAEGGTQEEAARELGLSSWTLSRWGRQHRPGKQSVEAAAGSKAFHPIAVKREEAESVGALTVHGPGGVRVEGLTLRQVAALLKELA